MAATDFKLVLLLLLLLSLLLLTLRILPFLRLPDVGAVCEALLVLPNNILVLLLPGPALADKGETSDNANGAVVNTSNTHVFITTSTLEPFFTRRRILFALLL